MKKIFNLRNVLFLFSLLLCSCSDNEGQDTPPPAEIELSEGTSDRQEIFADQTQPDDKGISFTSQGPWKAIVEEVVKTKATASTADWVILSQYSGDKAGNYTISITLTPNFTGKERQAVIRIICGDTEITIIIVQKGVAESGTIPRMINEIVYTQKLGKDANIIWGEPETTTISYYYDERDRVVKVIRTKSVESDDNENRIITYTFDYDAVGEITINETEKGKDGVAKTLAKLDNQGRIMTIEEFDIPYKGDSYEFSYNEAGQLAKMFYTDGPSADKYWDKYGYTDGMLNKFTEWWNGTEDVTEIPINQLYPNRYSANTTNIDLNSVEWFGEEVINLLYGMRRFGVGSKCLMEISMVYEKEEGSLEPGWSGFSKPNQVFHKEYKSIKTPKEGLEKQYYEFDANQYVTKFYSHRPYDIFLVTYDIVVGNELVNPEYPEQGYKAEIKNRKETKIGEDHNTHTYTVKYQN